MIATRTRTVCVLTGVAGLLLVGSSFCFRSPESRAARRLDSGFEELARRSSFVFDEVGGRCEDLVWLRFLWQPTASGLSRIQERVAACEREVTCRARLRPSEEELLQLLRHVRDGDPIALRTGFWLLDLFGPGIEAHVLKEALAEQIVRDPTAFLRLVVEHRIAETLLYTIYGSRCTGPPNDHVETLRSRYAAIETVSAPKLLDERRRALDALGEELDQIEQARQAWRRRRAERER